MDEYIFKEELNNLFISDPNCFKNPKRVFAVMCDNCYDRDKLLEFKEVIMSSVGRQMLEMKQKGSIDFKILYKGLNINEQNHMRYTAYVRTLYEILGFSQEFEVPDLDVRTEAINKSIVRISLKKEDNEKSADEYYKLACVQKTTRGIENIDIYIANMQKASDLGHRLARHTMARFLYKGKYVAKDITAAIELLKKCAEDGDSICLLEIADLYRKEEKDTNKYLEYLRKAVDADVREAKYDLAMVYYNNGTAEDYKKSVQILKSSVEDGDINSMYQLALCYRFGRGVESNMKEAMDLLRKAAANGHSKAKEIIEG